MPGVQPSSAGGSGRGARGRRTTSTLSEINVVPLVDVMLVLLIIFMVTAPMIQRGVEVNLPVSREANRIEGERLFVTIPAAFRKNRTVFMGEEPIRIDILQERIRQKMETSSDKQVYLNGDGSVVLEDLVDVFNRLKAAGVQQVGIMTEAPKN